MTITLADLPAEFAATDPLVVELYIDAAENSVDRAGWVCAGANPDSGVKLLASHFLKTAGLGSGSASFLITNKAIGGVSVGVKVGSEGDGPHGSTAYGRAFDAMQKRVNSAPRSHAPPRPRP